MNEREIEHNQLNYQGALDEHNVFGAWEGYVDGEVQGYSMFDMRKQEKENRLRGFEQLIMHQAARHADLMKTVADLTDHVERLAQFIEVQEITIKRLWDHPLMPGGQKVLAEFEAEARSLEEKK